jgi:hypothetical protein
MIVKVRGVFSCGIFGILIIFTDVEVLFRIHEDEENKMKRQLTKLKKMIT